MKKYRIAIFASGNGSNAEEIMKYFHDHASIEVGLLLSNNANAFALERAKKYNVEAKSFDRQAFAESGGVLQWLKEKQITHLVLAGFLWLIPDYLVRSFPGRIINIHPALLPQFGGKGMFGMKVHEAVKQSGNRETGITIHLVNEHYDEGQIVFQTRCPLEAECTAEDIAHKVHALEYEHYPPVIEHWIQSGVESYHPS